MTPPAPIPEHEFERILRENLCRSEKRGSGEYAILRDADGKLVSSYAVRHKRKREVKPVYMTNFLKALERIKQEEEFLKSNQNDNVAGDRDQTWQDAEWYQKQEKLSEHWKQLREADEGNEMISKEKIKKTAVCYWSAADETFVVESAMMPHVVIGVGDTSAEALRNFDTVLDTVYGDIISDNVAGYKLGRPAKGYVPFNVNIRPSSKSRILELAKELDISQGEAFDYLVFFYECKLQEHSHVPDKDELVKALEQFKEQQIQLVEKIEQITRVS